jgi:hypothetical protein
MDRCFWDLVCCLDTAAWAALVPRAGLAGISGQGLLGAVLLISTLSAGWQSILDSFMIGNLALQGQLE